MKFLKDTGFVIKRTNLGECDRFVTIFTKNNGKIEVLAKGVRKITSRRSSSTELLNLIKFQAVKSSKSYILTEVELINSFSFVKTDLEKIQDSFLVCELINSLCPDSQKNYQVLGLIYKTIIDMKNSNGSIFDFQVKLLIYLGYWDENKKFADERDLRQFIENIIERKIKSRTCFKN